MQPYHQKKLLKKLKFVSFKKWGAPPAVKRPGGNLKIILDNICPTAAGLAQQWWKKPVLAKERVLYVCQSVCLSVSMPVCLTVSLYVLLSVFLSVLISAISHQQVNLQCPITNINTLETVSIQWRQYKKPWHQYKYHCNNRNTLLQYKYHGTNINTMALI